MILKSIAKNTKPETLNKRAGKRVTLMLLRTWPKVSLSAERPEMMQRRVTIANAMVNIRKRMKDDFTILLLTGPSTWSFLVFIKNNAKVQPNASKQITPTKRLNIKPVL
jgi:hypothetical protein